MAIIPTQQYSRLPVAELPLLDLTRNIGMALTGSGSLSTWAETFCGQAPHVFCGSDPDNPPAQDTYPLIEVFPLSDNAGRQIDQYDAYLGLVCGIYDDSLEPVVYKDFELQRGVLRLEEFFSRIKTVIASDADLGDGYIAEIIGQRDDNVLFPFFVIGAHIKIIKPL